MVEQYHFVIMEDPFNEDDRMKRLQDNYGYRAFKLHIAKRSVEKNEDSYPGHPQEVVQAVQKAVSKDTLRMVDPNGAYMVDRAIELG